MAKELHELLQLRSLLLRRLETFTAKAARASRRANAASSRGDKHTEGFWIKRVHTALDKKQRVLIELKKVEEEIRNVRQ